MLLIAYTHLGWRWESLLLLLYGLASDMQAGTWWSMQGERCVSILPAVLLGHRLNHYRKTPRRSPLMAHLGPDWLLSAATCSCEAMHAHPP
jgi:hypothetical protein